MRRNGQRRLTLARLEDRITPANLAITSALLVDNAFPQMPAPTPVLGQRLYVRANWNITGLSGADQYPLRISVDGVAVDSFDFFGFPGTNVPISGQLDGWYSTPGSHTVMITLDPNNAVTETNENDNTISFNFTTGPVVNLAEKFITPLTGFQNQQWQTAYYHDLDPRPGVYSDYRGGQNIYDGHAGWDLGVPNFTFMDRGLAVSAAAAGVVTIIGNTDAFDRWSTYDFNRPNNTVLIDHGNGWSTFYGHLGTNSITVKVGDAVRAGQVIGLVGSSGNSSAAHLHFVPLYRGCEVETAFSFADYWQNPPVYPRDNPPAVLDVGVTNLDMFTEPDTAERLEDMTTFSTTSNDKIYFWYYPNRINAGETVNVHFYRPDNFEFVYGYTQMEDFGGGFWQNWTLFPNVYNSDPGTWQVALKIGGIEVAHRSFNVTTGTGVASARVFDVMGREVANERTTPFDIGSAPFGGAATSYMFAIKNHGSAPLSVSDLQLPTGFALSGAFPSTIAANATANFTLQLTTAVAGSQFGDVRFNTSDPETPIYHFNISGTVTGSAPAGAPVIVTALPATAYYFGGEAVLLNPSATVTDSNSANFSGGSLLVELASGGDANDRLTVRHQGNGAGQIGVSGTNISFGGILIGTMNGGSGPTPLTIMLTSNATPVAVQALVRNLTYNSVAATPQNHRRYVRLTLNDDTELSSNRAIVDVIHAGKPAAPRVAGVQVNNGSSQRSRVTSVTVSFDEVVSLPNNPADAFHLVRQGDNAVVALTASVVHGATTVVTLTFQGAVSDSQSLQDGKYTLTIDAMKVSNAGPLDGNNDGAGGDNYILVGDPGVTPKLFRLYGDSDGNNIIDLADFALFRFAFSPGYNSIFDFDNDGFVTLADFAEFRSRFGTHV